MSADPYGTSGAYTQTTTGYGGNHTTGGSKYGYFYYGSLSSALITPAFNLVAGKTYQFSFWYANSSASAWASLSVKYGTTNTLAGLTNIAGSVPVAINSTTYRKYTTTITPGASGVYYIGVVAAPTAQYAGSTYLAVDDLNMIELLPCNGMPSAGVVNASTLNPCAGNTVSLVDTTVTVMSGITMNWQDSTVAHNWQDIVVTGTNGANTSYYTTGPINDTVKYRMRIKCNLTGDSTVSAVVQINPNYPPLPYYETFESITAANQLPGCMTAALLGSNVYTYTSDQTSFNRTNHTAGGSKFASQAANTSGGGASALFTPAFKLKAGTTYEFSFWYRLGNTSNGAPGNADWTFIGAKYGLTATLGGMSNSIGNVRTTPLVNTDYRYFAETFTPTVSGTYYLGVLSLHVTGGTSYMSVDDIGLAELPPCSGVITAGAGRPVALDTAVCPGSVTDIQPDTAILTGSSRQSNVHYQWQVRTNSTGWVNVAVNGTDTLRRYITDPINDTVYYRVAMTCRNTGSTDTSRGRRILPSYPTVPYLETFEGITAANTLPRCMTSSALGSRVLSYIANQSTGNRTNHTTGGSKFVTFDGGATTTDGVYTPGLYLRADSTYEFSFWYITGTGTTAAPTNWNALDIRVGTIPDFGQMGILGAVRPVPVSNTTYQRFTATFRPTASGVYYFGVAAGRTLVSGNYLSIDDIGVNILPKCGGGRPAAGTAVATSKLVCPGGVTQVNITGASNAGNVSYQWEESGDNGLTFGNASAGSGMTTRYYETGPVNDTMLYRLRFICNSGNDTSWSVADTVRPQFPAIPYIETFESITAANQLPGCMSATNLGTGTTTFIANQTSGNRTNHTAGGSKFATFVTTAGGSNAIYSPGMYLYGGQTYKFSYWYNTGNSGIGAPLNVTSLSAYYGMTPGLTGMNLIGSVQSSPVMNTTYQQFQETFVPALSGVYYLGVQVSSTASTASYVTIDDIGLDSLSFCSGTPDAGTITSVTPCPNVPFTLRSTGGTSRFSVAGLTFQWKDSSSVNQGWFPSAGPTATTSDYTTSMNVPTKYRLIVTCTASGLVDSTDDIQLNLAPFQDCYCTPTYATGAANSGITKVTLRNLVNSSGVAYPWYTDYAPQQPASLPIPLLTMTVTDTLYVTQSSNSANYTGVWIDFNHNSVFDANEYFTDGVSVGAAGIAKIAVNPPASALFGLTRMRIRSGDRASVTQSMPCAATGSAYGEAEDYYVTLQYPPCAGPTNAGTAVSSDQSTCVGYSVDLADTTHENRMSGTSWSWQWSEDGGLSWNAVANSANKDTLNNVLITRAMSYRLRMLCENTGDSTFSTPANITIKPPYACYCVSQSTGTVADYSDIGAVQIGNMVNNTGGPHILNPEATRRHTFYTEIPNITMSADGAYRLSIYHIQRNATHENARVSVFVDYNNDLVYNAAATPTSERVFTGLTSAGNFYIDTMLHVPNAVIPNAPTGLRVVLNSDLDPNAPANLGCGEYLSGETEDYVVTFNRAPAGIGGVNGNVQSMMLYPNPTEGRFTVNVSGARALGEVSVQVTTITGQSVLKKSFGSQGAKFSTEVDLGGKASGIYFVEVRAGEEQLVRKLIVR